MNVCILSVPDSGFSGTQKRVPLRQRLSTQHNARGLGLCRRPEDKSPKSNKHSYCLPKRLCRSLFHSGAALCLGLLPLRLHSLDFYLFLFRAMHKPSKTGTCKKIESALHICKFNQLWPESTRGRARVCIEQVQIFSLSLFPNDAT